MTKLSVNINKIATLRNARGDNNPDVIKTALDIVKFGAEGITVHPRPDERHIRKTDVLTLAEVLDVEFNIEGYPSDDFLALVVKTRPTQCTFVPDAPDVFTSNAGWNVKTQIHLLEKAVKICHEQGIRTSLFIDPSDFNEEMRDLLIKTGTDRIELYTKAYADSVEEGDYEKTLSLYKTAAEKIHEAGIGINAGHDLNLINLPIFIKAIPCIQEVSIGHALICDALYLGLEKTIQAYLAALS